MTDMKRLAFIGARKSALIRALEYPDYAPGDDAWAHAKRRNSWRRREIEKYDAEIMWRLTHTGERE